MSDEENGDAYLDSTIQQRVFCANMTAGTQVLPCVELPLLISRIALLVDEDTTAKRGSLVTVSIQREDDEEAARVCNFRVGTVEQCDVSLALHPLDGDVAFIVTGTVGVSLLGEELIPVDMDADGYGDEEEEEEAAAAARIEDDESEEESDDDDEEDESDDAMKGVTREQLVQMMKEQGHLDAGDESASDDEESDSAEDSASDRAAFAAEVAAKKSQKRAAPSSDAANSAKKAKKTSSSSSETERAASSSAPKGYLKGKEGLFYKDEVVGRGAKPKRGKRVSVHYKGFLQNGTTFDETAQKPFKFRLGVGEVIKGWDIGIASMRVGGRRTLILPPHLAYGKKSPGAAIPANATLTFEVELTKA